MTTASFPVHEAMWRDRAEFRRWSASLALMLGLHVGGIGALLYWKVSGESLELPPPILVDMAPAVMPEQKGEAPPAPPQPVRKETELQPMAKAEPKPKPRKETPKQNLPRPKPVVAAPPLPEAPAGVRSEATLAAQEAAPPVPPAAAHAGEASPAYHPADGVPNWQGLLLARLEKFKHYPRLCQLQRQEGVVHLSFAMDREGKVLSFRIERSSGVELLDEEVLALIQRAEPLPAPPPEVPGDPVRLTVPVKFFLR